MRARARQFRPVPPAAPPSLAAAAPHSTLPKPQRGSPCKSPAPPRRRARYVLQVMDIIWVLCLATSKRFSVPEPPLKVTRMVLQFDEEYEADEREVADKTQPLHGVEFK